MLNIYSTYCVSFSNPSGTSTGVFVGCIWTEFGDLIGLHYGSKGGASAVTGNGLAFMSGRLSYTLGLTGGGRGGGVIIKSAIFLKLNR